MQYTNYLYKVTKDWLYPPPPPQLTPLQKLRKMLEDQQSDYKLKKSLQANLSQSEDSPKKQQFYYRTKHTNSNIVIQRICMMYSNLIGNSKFSNFHPTTISSIIFSDLLKNQENQVEQLASIKGQVKIRTERIKCDLQIIIVFHRLIQTQIPWLYITNTDSYKMQPNRNLKHLYRQVLGGFLILDNNLRQKLSMNSIKNPKILKEQKYDNKWWQNYNSQNLQKIMLQKLQILTNYFPFVKRFIPWQQEQSLYQKQSPINITHRILSQSSSGLLNNIQKLTVLSYSLDSETKLLRENIEQLKREAYNLQNKQIKIDQLFDIKQGKQIYELLSEIKAYDDCQAMLENQIQHNRHNFLEILPIYKQICEKKIQIRFILDKIINQKYTEDKSHQ